MKNVAWFVFWLALPLIAGAIGAVASAGAPVFYGQLVKPTWAPPPSLFGPVWTTLYVLMGIAAFLVWRARGWTGVLTFFVVHLAFNALWSWLFFAWRLGAGSLIEIVALWLMIAALIAIFWRVRPLAGAMLIPYICWVSFATALNFTLWRMNPGLLR
jgi:benzodiazapine receptor